MSPCRSYERPQLLVLTTDRLTEGTQYAQSHPDSNGKSRPPLSPHPLPQRSRDFSNIRKALRREKPCPCCPGMQSHDWKDTRKDGRCHEGLTPRVGANLDNFRAPESLTRSTQGHVCLGCRFQPHWSGTQLLQYTMLSLGLTD